MLYKQFTLSAHAIFKARYLKFQNYLEYTTYWVLLGAPQATMCIQWDMCSKFDFPTISIIIKQAIFEARNLKFRNYLAYTTYWVLLVAPQATMCLQWNMCSKSHFPTISITHHPTQALLTYSIFKIRYLNFHKYLGYTTRLRNMWGHNFKKLEQVFRSLISYIELIASLTMFY